MLYDNWRENNLEDDIGRLTWDVRMFFMVVRALPRFENILFLILVGTESELRTFKHFTRGLPSNLSSLSLSLYPEVSILYF